jgi:hypothetical protein
MRLNTVPPPGARICSQLSAVATIRMPLPEAGAADAGVDAAGAAGA